MKIETDTGILDLFETSEADFYVTKQIYDLKELERRHSDHTRVLSIPNTLNNRDQLQIVSNVIREKLFINCTVKIQGVEIIQKGKLSVSAIYEDSLEIVIYSGSFNIFNSLKEDSIRSLNLTNYNVTLTGNLQPIISKVGIDFANHVQFDETSLLKVEDDAARNQLINSFDIYNTGVFFKLYYLLKEIIKQTGFNSDLTELNSDPFNKMALYCPRFNTLTSNQGTGTYEYNLTLSSDFYVDIGGAGFVDIPFSPYNTYQGVNSITITFDILYTTGRFGGSQVQIYDDVSGWLILSSSFFQNQGPHRWQGSIQYTPLQNDTRPKFKIGNNSGAQSGTDEYTVDDASLVVINFSQKTGDVNFNNILPDISQKELFRECLLMTGAIPLYNLYTNTISFKKLHSISVSTNVQEIQITGINKKNVGNLFYQKNLFTFQTDDLNTNNTEYYHQIPTDETAPLEGTLIDSSLYACDLAKVDTTITASQNDEKIEIPYLQFDIQTISIVAGTLITSSPEVLQPGDYVYYNNAWVRMETKDEPFTTNGAYTGDALHIRPKVTGIGSAKLAYIDDTDSQTIYYDENLMSVSNPLSNIPTAKFTKCRWDYLFSIYYQNIFNALNSLEIYEVTSLLSASEFQLLDLTKPVTNDKLNGTFYVNIVDQWKAKNECIIELIRLNRWPT
jgi:hypothetical protein